MCDRSDKNCKVILKYLPEYIIPPIEKIFDRFGGSVNEIRLRVGRPRMIIKQSVLTDFFRKLKSTPFMKKSATILYTVIRRNWHRGILLFREDTG